MKTTIQRAHIEDIADKIIDNLNLDIVNYVYDYFNNKPGIFVDSDTAEEISEIVYRAIKYRL